MAKYEHGIEWLLTGEPRPGQIEALARSYTGYAYRETRHDEPQKHPLAHEGSPARGWGHWMQMRVGKTPTWLNEFLLLRNYHGVRKGLMFAPNAFKYDWKREAEAFGVDVEVFVHDRDTAATDKWCREHPHDGLLVVNYEALVQEKNAKVIGNWVTPQTFIGADESVKIKNPNAITFKRILEVSRMAQFKRTLTGKPAPYSALDYYAQLKFTGHLNGLNQYSWRSRHCIVGGFKNKQIIGVKNPERLAATLRQTAFVAERKDWAEFHAPEYVGIDYTMNAAQLDAYTSMERDLVAMVGDEAISVDMAAHKHMKLQQIASGFMYDEGGDVHEIMSFEKTNKFKSLMEYIDESASDKIIVVYYYQPTGAALAKAMAKYKPAMIAGGTYMRQNGLDVASEKNRFNNDPECRVMIAQEVSVKYGHTLMGTEQNPCLDVAFYENSYSLDDRAQTEERPQGGGQLAPVVIADFVSLPIERKIRKGLIERAKLGQVVVDHYKSLANGR